MTEDEHALRKIRPIAVHAIVWIAYVLYESSLLLVVDGVRMNVWETGLNFVLYANIFYLHSEIILPQVVIRKRYYMVLGVLPLIALAVLMRLLLYRHVIPVLDSDMLYPFTSYKLFLSQSVWRGGYFIMLSTGYFFALHAVRTERERRKQAEARREHLFRIQEMEKNLMEAEILNLRSQINPHFLYNALNFFYSQIYPYSEKTANGILLLSDMMRYALKEDGLNGKVMLEEEVKHLENYIEMNQLRFDHHLQVSFQVDGSTSFRMIMPLILITFVENCFKHGDLLDPANPLLIRLFITNDQLVFYTFNKKLSGNKPISTGIGIDNIRRRLELGYPKRHSLVLKNTDSFYTCTLTLNL